MRDFVEPCVDVPPEGVGADAEDALYLALAVALEKHPEHLTADRVVAQALHELHQVVAPLVDGPHGAVRVVRHDHALVVDEVLRPHERAVYAPEDILVAEGAYRDPTPAVPPPDPAEQAQPPLLHEVVEVDACVHGVEVLGYAADERLVLQQLLMAWEGTGPWRPAFAARLSLLFHLVPLPPGRARRTVRPPASPPASGSISSAAAWHRRG